MAVEINVKEEEVQLNVNYNTVASNPEGTPTKENEIILFSVPTLGQNASDYTETDKAAVLTVINAVAAAEKPVVVMNADGSLIPASYFKQGTTHYFVGISPDSLPGEGGEVWFTYVKYNTANNSLAANTHANIGDDGEWLQDIADLETDFRIPTNNLVFKAVTLALENFNSSLEQLRQMIPTQSRITDITLYEDKWTDTDSPTRFEQIVEIEGVTNRSQVDLTPTPEQLETFRGQELALTARQKGGVVTVTAVGEKAPEGDHVVQVTITEVII